MKRHLEPTRPDNAEESHIREQVGCVGDGVVRCECSEIGRKEQVEEELDGIGFVALGEDKIRLIGSRQWGLDYWDGFV